MSDELTTTTQPQTLLPFGEDVSFEEIKDLLLEHVGVGGMKERQLEQIKMPSGQSKVFTLPGADGKDTYTDTFDFVILYTHESRAYWVAGPEESEKKNPDCASNDGVIGFGVPGGNCITCELARFGSGRNNAQACNLNRNILLYRGGPSIYPELFTVSPASVQNYSKWARGMIGVGLASQMATNRPISQVKTPKSVMVRVKLEPAQNRAGQKYMQATFSTLRDLTPQEISVRAKLESLLMPLLESVRAATHPAAAEPPAKPSFSTEQAFD